jgi:Leucine-rich repeat (LRR) protein
MTELEVLNLADNSLTGRLPPEVWRLKKLQFLLVYTNNLTGHLVVDGFAARGLNIISLSNNKLVGAIPKVFGRLENLTELWLNSNSFSGEIPASIS